MIAGDMFIILQKFISIELQLEVGLRVGKLNLDQICRQMTLDIGTSSFPLATDIPLQCLDASFSTSTGGVGSGTLQFSV